jgi:putative colanic acid biosynthesis UDP-glucose lipid carrier transferase
MAVAVKAGCLLPAGWTANRAMTFLAREFKSVGTELPLVALVRFALAPFACVLSLALCMLLYQEPLTGIYLALAGIALLVAVRVFGELPITNGRSPFLPGRAVVTDWITVAGVLLFIAFITKTSDLYSRKLLVTWFVTTPFVLHGVQELARQYLYRCVFTGTLARTKVIVGLNEMGQELAREIGEDACHGTVQGFFDDRADTRVGTLAGERVLGGIEEVAAYVKRHAIHVVYITLPMTRDRRLVRMLDELRDTTASVYFVPSTLPYDLIQARVGHIGSVPVIAVCETPFYGINGVLKRTTDVVFSIAILLAVWPLMAAAAVGIVLTSPGPVLFRQRRYGLDGKKIVVLKFRTMVVCEDGDCIEQAQRDDPRVTRFGAFLRRTSLDELPQFFNVLAGTMSIVGPRPHAVAHNETYRRLINGYMVRHKVRPGITGWAQISGLRGETASVEKMKQRIAYDLDYLNHWSLSLDLWIMLKTFLLLVKDNRAY